MGLLLVLSLAPVIALAIYIYVKDKFEKEPLSLLLTCLLGGRWRCSVSTYTFQLFTTDRHLY